MKGADADTDTDGDLFLASDEDEDSSSSSPLPVTPESATSSSKPPASLTGHAAGCGDGGGVGSDGITEREFSCHCCYDVLVDPTTLNCGHSFCRHCLAQWWESSHKTECPECREKWEGFPRVNILLR